MSGLVNIKEAGEVDMKLVPESPTEEMLDAGKKVAEEYYSNNPLCYSPYVMLKVAYEEMIKTYK